MTKQRVKQIKLKLTNFLKRSPEKPEMRRAKKDWNFGDTIFNQFLEMKKHTVIPVFQSSKISSISDLKPIEIIPKRINFFKKLIQKIKQLISEYLRKV